MTVFLSTVAKREKSMLLLDTDILPTYNPSYACPKLFLYVDHEFNEVGHST